MEYVSPKRLRPGARLAIVASASPFQADELLEGLDVIKECGFKPVLGINVENLRCANIHGASVDDRVDELMWAFSDPSIDGIVVATGGMGSAQLLPYLGYETIRRSRKPLLGMSDISALNNGILAMSRLISINGQSPSIRLEKQTQRDADIMSLRDTLKFMSDTMPWDDRPFVQNGYLPRCVHPGIAVGHVIGANMDTFSRLVGTRWMPPVQDAVVFIEDVHKAGTAIARELLHLQLAGVFDACAGVVVGEFAEQPKSDDPREPAIEDVLEEFFAHGGVPCSFGYSFSHGLYTIPIPVGSTCRLDAAAGEVSFDFRMA